MTDYMKISEITDGVNVIKIVGDKKIADIDGKTEMFDSSVDISQVFRYIHLVKEVNFLKKRITVKE